MLTYCRSCVMPDTKPDLHLDDLRGLQHDLLEQFAPPRQQWDEPQPAPLIIDLVRSEMAWPVRAHIEFTITNDRAP